MTLAEICKDVVAKLDLYGYSPGEFVKAFQFAVRSPSCLSEREMQLLRMIASGKTAKDAALAWSVSVKTVDSHRYNLYRKLGLHNTAQAIHYAFAHGLCGPVNHA